MNRDIDLMDGLHCNAKKIQAFAEMFSGCPNDDENELALPQFTSDGLNGLSVMLSEIAADLLELTGKV